MTTPVQIERRAFLQRLAASGLVLVVGATGVRRLEALDAHLNPVAGDPFAPSVYLSIGEDGIVTVIVHRSEMGQGARTGLVMAMAEDLEADWSMVRAEQAIGDPKYGSQNTDGSTSIRDGSYLKFRQAGAAARVMLERAAAAEWGVPEKEVAGQNGRVAHARSGRSLAYGKLVARARLLPVPTNVPLKPESQFRFIGKQMPALDLKATITGAAMFGQDLAMPGMKIAVVLHPPVYGATVASFDATAALAVMGVERVLEIPSTPIPSGFMPLGGVAVVATSTWAAIEGRKKLVVRWNASPNDGYDSAAYRAELEASVRAAGNTVLDRGNVESALGAAAKTLQAEYYVPHLAQAPMEPPAALATVVGDRCEAWACTQDPQSARDTVGAMLKIAKERVTVHATMLGGGFGRKSKPDFIAEAAWLSQQVGAPVKVVWTREDDIQNGFPHSVSMQRLEAGLDAKGKIVAWRHRTASPPIGSTFEPGQDFESEGELVGGVLDLPYDIANVRAETCRAPAHARIGWYRSVTAIFHAFAINSFMDELAHAAGRDPLEFMLGALGSDRIIDMTTVGAAHPVDNYGATWEEHPHDIARYRRVLQAVAKASGWGRPLPKGEGRGVAVHKSFLTYVASVVHVKVGARGALSIPRVDIAMDCGYAVHPERVRSQCEGAVIMSLSNALVSELSYANGRTVQRSLNTYKVLRMNAAPKEIRVHLVHTGGPIGGVGEPGVPPVAPALANAIFAATGKRIRTLPVGNQLAGG